MHKNTEVETQLLWHIVFPHVRMSEDHGERGLESDRRGLEGQWEPCLQPSETGRRTRRREWTGRFSLGSVDTCQWVTAGAMNVSQFSPARLGRQSMLALRVYLCSWSSASARKLMRPVWVMMRHVRNDKKPEGKGSCEGYGQILSLQLLAWQIVALMSIICRKKSTCQRSKQRQSRCLRTPTVRFYQALKQWNKSFIEERKVQIFTSCAQVSIILNFKILCWSDRKVVYWHHLGTFVLYSDILD